LGQGFFSARLFILLGFSARLFILLGFISEGSFGQGSIRVLFGLFGPRISMTRFLHKSPPYLALVMFAIAPWPCRVLVVRAILPGPVLVVSHARHQFVVVSVVSRSDG
jgi:hypothetical protein